MKTNDITATLTVDQTPEQLFAAINDVRGWWSQRCEGASQKLGDEFTFTYEDIHRCTMRLTEVVPGKKVVWLVLDSYLQHSNGKNEWKDTRISFELEKKGSKTELHFTHFGITPECDCYESCVRGWNFFITESLRDLVTKGTGKPLAKKELQKTGS